MQLQHEFSVPVGLDQAWDALLDYENLAPCLPGAKLTSIDGQELQGSVKVKLGPVLLNYRGTANIETVDAEQRVLALSGSARDAGGNGTAKAKVTARLSPIDESLTTVTVLTDLNVTGRPAQFGRGMMQEVSGRIVNQFAERLATRLTHVDLPTPEATQPRVNGATIPAHRADPGTRSAAEADSDDILDLASLIKPDWLRPAAVAGLVLGGAILVTVLFRRRR
jgi:carbon monoxide dehydrogenase subunit G